MIRVRVPSSMVVLPAPFAYGAHVSRPGYSGWWLKDTDLEVVVTPDPDVPAEDFSFVEALDAALLDQEVEAGRPGTQDWDRGRIYEVFHDGTVDVGWVGASCRISVPMSSLRPYGDEDHWLIPEEDTGYGFVPEEATDQD